MGRASKVIRVKQIIRTVDALWKLYARLSHDLPNTDGEFDRPQLVTVEDYKPPRSLSQNARLHCMIRPLAEKTGFSESELKEFFKSEYGPKKRVQVGDIDKLIPLSTTEYNKQQMQELIAQVDRVCAENGVYVEPEA